MHHLLLCFVSCKVDAQGVFTVVNVFNSSNMSEYKQLLHYVRLTTYPNSAL